MKKIQGKKLGKSGTRLLRHWVKKMFGSWIKRQSCECHEDVATLVAKLRGIEESIEMIAREIARQAKRTRH